MVLVLKVSTYRCDSAFDFVIVYVSTACLYGSRQSLLGLFNFLLYATDPASLPSLLFRIYRALLFGFRPDVRTLETSRCSRR